MSTFVTTKVDGSPKGASGGWRLEQSESGKRAGDDVIAERGSDLAPSEQQDMKRER